MDHVEYLPPLPENSPSGKAPLVATVMVFERADGNFVATVSCGEGCIPIAGLTLPVATPTAPAAFNAAISNLRLVLDRHWEDRMTAAEEHVQPSRWAHPDRRRTA